MMPSRREWHRITRKEPDMSKTYANLPDPARSTEEPQPRVVPTPAPLQIDKANCPQRIGGVHRGPWTKAGACPQCGFTARTMRTS